MFELERCCFAFENCLNRTSGILRELRVIFKQRTSFVCRMARIYSKFTEIRLDLEISDRSLGDFSFHHEASHPTTSSLHAHATTLPRSEPGQQGGNRWRGALSFAVFQPFLCDVACRSSQCSTWPPPTRASHPALHSSGTCMHSVCQLSSQLFVPIAVRKGC